MFVNRLTRTFMLDRQFKGFIPDIYLIVLEYGLEECLDYYWVTSCLPFKHKWQCTLKRVIYDRWQNDTLEILKWKLRMILEDLFPLKTNVSDKNLTKLQKQHWEPGLIVARSIARTCNLCNTVVTNGAAHRLYFCLMCEVPRKQLWYTVIDQGGTKIFNELKRSTIIDQCARLLSLSTQCVERQLRFPDITIVLGRYMFYIIYSIVLKAWILYHSLYRN